MLTREYVTNELLNGDLIPDGDENKNQPKSSTQKTPKRTPARKAQKSKINYIESSEKSDSESDRNSENSDYNPSNDSNITDPSSEIKTNTKSRKLSEILGPESKKISKKFLQEKLVHEIYKFYNSQVFKNKLPENLSIKWSNRLNKTAGYCYLGSRMTGRDPVTGLAKFERTARIELASKVIDDRFKLRDTLLHELCHAASYLIDGVKDGHGNFFKKWGRHCNELLPDIPVVSRCHSYQINYKFVYVCSRCGQNYGRHSKSIDVGKKCCGICKGKLELKDRKGKVVKEGLDKENAASSSAPKVNPFADFVKNNYKREKGVTHSEVMKMLSEKWKQLKIRKDVPFTPSSQ